MNISAGTCIFVSLISPMIIETSNRTVYFNCGIGLSYCTIVMVEGCGELEFPSLSASPKPIQTMKG